MAWLRFSREPAPTIVIDTSDLAFISAGGYRALQAAQVGPNGLWDPRVALIVGPAVVRLEVAISAASTPSRHGIHDRRHHPRQRGRGHDCPARSTSATDGRDLTAGVRPASTPAVEGLELSVREAGSRMELTNRTGLTVVVRGYQDEPYIRIDADGGVFRNTRSPASHLNEDRQGRTDIPDRADPDAPPHWQRISEGTTERWHDHRAHWMGDVRPSIVAADPSTTQTVVEGWKIPLDVGDRAITVTGDLDWVPAPSPWPWLAGAALVGAGTPAAARPWGRPVVLGAVAALAAATMVEAAGSWTDSTNSLTGKLGDMVVPVIAWSILGAAASQLWRSPGDASLLIGGAATGLPWLFGVSDYSWLFASQLPTGVAPNIAPVRSAPPSPSASRSAANAVLDAHQLLGSPWPTRPAPPQVAVPTSATDPQRRHRRVLLVMLDIVAIAFALATAPPP